MRKHSMKDIEGCWKGSKKNYFETTRGVKKMLGARNVNSLISRWKLN
jgi:hypothetical protein